MPATKYSRGRPRRRPRRLPAASSSAAGRWSRSSGTGSGAEVESRSSRPAAAWSSIAASRASRANGPIWSSEEAKATMPYRLTRPYVGLSPTMPVRAAGWRMEPPVSVPMLSGTWPAATLAAEPPELPPGTRPRSHGFAVGPYAECSVDDPIANSSMFSLPRITAPASRSRSVIWASYGETYPARIREPAVHWPPRTDTRSLRPTGTPHSGCSDASAAAPPLRATASRASASSAAPRAPAPSRTSHALSAGFSRAARARCASTSSRDERSPARSRSLIAAAVRRVSPVFVMERSVAAEDGGHHDVAPVPFRGVRQRFGLRERGPRDVLAEDVFQLDRLGRRRDGIRVEPSQDRVLVEDVVQLAHEARQLLVGQAETGEVGDVLDLVAREGPHGDR